MRSQLANDEQSTVVRFRFRVRGVEWLVERSPYQFIRRKSTGLALSEKYLKLTRLSGAGAPQLIPPAEAQARIEAEIGLRYEDFSKILVLPQGEFQQFLAMKSDKRADLLKTLFPVRQHEAIARAAKDQVREIKVALAALDAVIKELARECNEARFVEDEQVLGDVLTQRQDVERVAQAAHTTAQQVLTAAQTLHRQLTDLAEKRRAHGVHLGGQPEHAVRQQTLAAAQRAATAVPVLDRAEALARELQALATQLTAADVATTGTAAQVAELQTAIGEIPARRERLQQALSGAEALARRADDLRQLAADRHALRAADAQVAARAQTSAQRVQARDAAQAALAALDAVHGAREVARPALAAAEATLQKIRLAEQDARQLEAWRLRRMHEARTRIAREQAALAEFAVRLAEADGAVQAAQQRLNANAALLVAAALQPGEPCLACGSREHPHPNRGNPQDGDLAALLRLAETARRSAADGHGAQDKLVTELLAGFAVEEAAADQAQNRLRDAGFADAATWRAALTAAQAAVEKLQADDAALAVQLATRPAAQATLTRAQQAADAARDGHQLAVNQLAAARATVAGVAARIGEVPDLDEEMARVAQAHGAALQANGAETDAIAALQTRWQTVNAAHAAAVSKQQTLAAAHAAKRVALPAVEAEAQDALRTAEFADSAAARQAARTAAELDGLQRHIVEWQGRLTSLADAIAALDTAVAGQPPPDVAQLETQLAATHAAARQATEARMAAQTELQALRDKAARLAAKRAERAQVVADAEGMLVLSQHLNGELAPKIDFPTWMLTWWLERVLQQANRRMTALSDSRYTFALRTSVQDGRRCAGLDVDVVDTWSNQRRDVNALSGGEKFLASLSLALGLADVVQGLNGGVQLDTLFIDEGFGSLDADTLDRAMDLVNQIAEHRAVGLISHVEAMQKAIVSQIRVTKSPQGSQVRVAALGVS